MLVRTFCSMDMASPHVWITDWLLFFFLGNNWNLSPSVTRIWRKGESSVEIRLGGNEVNKWFAHPAFETECLSLAVVLLNWVRGAARSQLYPGKSFGKLPRSRFYLHFLFFMCLCFSVIRCHHTLPFFPVG